MTVLVTGGAGFIGSFIVDELVARGHKVRVFDNLDPQVHLRKEVPDYLNKNVEFIQGDVRDYEAFKRALSDVEVVFHKAGTVGIGQSQYEIKKYVDVNIGGTANLMDILVNHNHKVKKLIVAASMSSYGEGCYECERCGGVRPRLRPVEQLVRCDWEVHCPCCDRIVKPVPTDEGAERNCNSIYSLTKRDQEDMALMIGRLYDIPTVVLRYFNVYGPRQSLSNPYTGVTAIFMSRIKNDKAPVVYEDGLQTRDFISIHDVVKANMLVMESDKGDCQVFNVGSGIPLAIKDIALTLTNLYGKDIKPEITREFRKGDVRHCYANTARIKEKLGWEPGVGFEEGMKELIDWAQEAEAVDSMDKAVRELKEKGLA